jgi:methionyl-tRNA synthetase
MDDVAPHQALARIFDLVRVGNKYVDTEAPWALNKKKDPRLSTVLRTTLELGALVSALLVPFLPSKGAQALGKFGKDAAWGESLIARVVNAGTTLSSLDDGARIDVGDPLFPRFLELPPQIAALFLKETPVSETTPPAAPAPAGKPTITYDDFAKLELKVGRIVAAEKHPNADKLLVLKVDIGEAAPRTIVAGIAKKFAPEQLTGRSVVVVTNLAPAKLRGVVSEGMLLAAGGDQLVDLVSVAADPGTIVR